jgi:hypothetical protein
MIDQRSGVSHVTCATRTLANAEHLPNALKMNSQPCCKVHFNLAKLKSCNVRSGQERDSSTSRRRKKIKIFFCYHSQCVFDVRISPAFGASLPATGSCHSLMAACSLPTTEADLLHLLDLDNCKDSDTISAFSLVNTPLGVSSLGHSTQGPMACRMVPSQGMFTSPLLSTPVQTGGDSCLPGGGWGVGGAGGIFSPETCSKASSNIRPSFVSKNAESPQVCIFIEEADIKSLCLG